MKPNKFIIEKQVSEFRMDNGLSTSEAITLKSLLLKLNILTVFKPLSENFSGMCLKDASEHRFMLINSNQPRGRQHFTIAHELYHLYIEERPTPHKCNPGFRKRSDRTKRRYVRFFLIDAGVRNIPTYSGKRTKH